MPKKAEREPEPLRPVVFAVLIALSEQKRHGYGIMKVVNERMSRRAVLGPGTLYRTLKELRDDGLIEYAPAPSDADSRRRYYAITARGRVAARAEATRMAELVDAARASRLLADGPRG
jgi:DNA-binding PadR family transcriptional regulator